MTLGGSPGEEQGGSGTQASWGGVSPWLVLTLSLAWALAVVAGPAPPTGRWSRWLQGLALVPSVVWGPGNTVPGRQAAASEPCLLSSLLSEPPDTPLQTLAHHSLHRPPPGMEKSPAPEGPGSTGTDKTHLRLLLPAASPVLGCDHDRSAGCQGPALLLLPRGDTSPQVPFIPPTHRGMSVGGGGSLACPRPPVVTFGDFLLKDQWRRG